MISFFKKFWNGETDGLTAAALIVGASSLASRVLGIWRDRVLASTFGAGDVLDAYYAAFRLPDTVYNLVILGALSAGFIPVFTEWLERKGKPEAFKLASQVISTVGVIMAIASGVIALFAPWIVPMLAPGFSPEKLELTVSLTRVMALSPFFLGLSAVLGGVLQSLRMYAGYAMAPVLYNLGIIVGVWLLVPVMGPVGLAWGVVLGAASHFLIQLLQAINIGFNRVSWPTLRSEGVRRILTLMAPRAAGLGVSQINLIVLLALATTIETGAVAVFNLANNLQSFPIGLIGISFAIAAFPALSRASGAKDEKGYKEALASAAKKILFFTIPATALFILLRAQIVRIVLGDGLFNWTDTIRTADMLGWFALSIAVQSLIPLYARAFYAVQDTRTPLVIGIFSEVLNLSLALFLSRYFGIVGLAMALSAAAFLQFVLLYLFLRRKRGSLGGVGLFASVGRALLATAVMCLIAYPLRQWIGTIYPLRMFWQVALQFVLAASAGGIAYLVASWMLKSPEFAEFSQVVEKRLWRRATVKETSEGASGMTQMR